MSALVKLLGSFAPGHVLSHEGKDFTFRAIDQQLKAALTVAYFRRAREAVYLLKDEVDAADYERQLGRVMDAYRRGEFDFPGMEAFGYFMTRGLPELVAHLTGCKPAEAQALLEARPVEVLHVVLCVTFASMGGEPEGKKKLLSLEDTPAMRQLVELLQSSGGSPTPNGNGSPSPPPTSAPTSGGSGSIPTSSQG